MFFKRWLNFKSKNAFIGKPNVQSGQEEKNNATENKIEENKPGEISQDPLTALVATSDLAMLENLALTGRSAQVRQQAITRIDDLAILRRIEEASKHKDKTVHRIAKNKLQQHREQEKQQQQLRETAEQICAGLENHSHISVDVLFEPKWKLLQQQWQQLPAQWQAEHQSRFSAANAQCEQHYQAYIEEQQQMQIPQQSVEEQEAHHEQQQACIALEQVRDLIRRPEGLAQADVPGLNALLTTQHNRWQVAQETYVATPELIARFQRVYQQVAQGLEALDRARAQAATKKIRAEQEKQAQEKIKLIQQKISHVRELLEAGSVSEAQHGMKDIYYQVDLLPKDKQVQVLASARDITAQLNELKRWQNFALAPKKEALCQSMQALITDANEPEELAEKIKLLQDESESLGHADSKIEQELWLRFKAAGDQAFEPCRLYYAEQAQQRRDNAEKRKVLCEQLENYEQANEWRNADWPSVLAIIKCAKTEWRNYSPIDRKDVQALQERFDAIMAKIQLHLDGEYEKNQRQKIRLIEQTKALLKMDSVAEAINEVKKLQQAWQQVGLTAQKIERQLWNEFRQQCDALFNRRQASFAEQEIERLNNQKTAEALIAELQQLTEASLISVKSQRELSGLIHQAESLTKKFEALSSLPKAVASQLSKQFSTVRRSFQQQQAQIKKQLADQQLNNLWRKAELCGQLETLVLAGENNVVQIENIKQQWQALTNIAESAETLLNARFNHALTALLENQQQALQQGLEKSRALCHELVVRMEILANLESPAEDKEKRMALQVNRLAKTMGQGKARTVEDEAHQLYVTWCANGPVGNYAEIAHWVERFRAAAAHFAA